MRILKAARVAAAASLYDSRFATMWLFTIAAVLLAAYLYATLVSLRYWQRRGVPFKKPLPLVGNLGPLIIRKTNFSTLIRNVIEPFRERGYCGFYQWHKPVLLVWDPDMSKQVLTKDFSSFHDRGQPFDEENDPLSAHLFNLEGARWRSLRNKLSPTFTSGKLKLMYPIMRDVSLELNDVMQQSVKATGSEVDVKELLTRYATDMIGTCAFGIQCNSLTDENSEFLIMSRESFRLNFMTLLWIFLVSINRKLARLLPQKTMFSKSTNFFLNLMKDSVEYRETNNVDRKDFVNLLMQLRDSERAETNIESRINFTNGLMTSQAFIFFIAGLENIANNVGYCIQQLAFDTELQRRAADEVRAVVKEHDGQLSYEALQKMDLVDRILKEGLRIWSSVGSLLRRCNRTTTVGGVVVEEGVMVMICTETMHKDPNHFPDLDRFDPDRFTEEARSARHPYAFLPFGEGPRICIAERFAMLEMKLALASLLNDFEFTPSSKTERVPELDVSSFAPSPKNGFPVLVQPRA